MTNLIKNSVKIRLELTLEGHDAIAFEAFKSKEKLKKNATAAFKLVAEGLERAGFLQPDAESETVSLQP